MKNKTRPSVYQPPLPFHATRAVTLLSAAVVGGILAYFIAQLRADGFRLPWTFLVMFLADILLILSLILTYILHFCVNLSPLLNMIVNIPVLLLWTIGWGLLIWNMYGTLGHSCTAANWGNSDGIKICHEYKALFSFVIFGWLGQIALLVLDVRAKRHQNASGRYNKMQTHQDLKVDSLEDSRNSSVHDIPYGAGLDGARERQLQQQQQSQQSGLSRALSRASSFYTGASPQDNNPYKAYRQPPQFDPAYTRGGNYHNVNDFGYSAPSQQTQYDNYYGR